MAVANLKSDLLETLKSDAEVAALDGGEQIFLTPYLALACGLLYMMASDGELEAQESSQLQAVLGGDKAVLSYALRYVQSVPVEQFFATASEMLSVKDKWCILTNVCDALLADGHADRAELALFAQMTKAFGVHESQFESYFKILELKNDKSVLGRYAGVKDDRRPMTPHFALAIALLYMLTSDGSIGAQEVGQLEAAIGEFDGLQNVALKYVRSVKLKQFLDEAAAMLKPEQKIYILTNVCDSMLSDGEVANLEDKLFLNMLTAFGYTEKTFARYLQVLETKNFKPFDTSAFKNRVTHERVTGVDDADGVLFKNELAEAANQGVWVGSAANTEMSQFIARTMDDNIQSVSDDFENQGNVVKVGQNATDGLNLQKIGDGDSAANRQRAGESDPADNLQKVEASASEANRQTIDGAVSIANHQLIGSDGTGVNLQAIDVDADGTHREAISPEVRAQNIQVVAEEVNHRLDRFEVAHSQFLQIGRTQKFTNAFVPIEHDASDLNRQLVDESFARMGLGGALVDTSSAVLSVPESEAAGAPALASQDAAVVPAGSVAKAAPPLPQKDPSAARTNRRSAATKEHRFGQAGLGLYRGRGFAYVQLAVAAFAVAFAAPIDMRTALGRSATGPLIMMPTLVPGANERRHVLESELSSAQGEAQAMAR
ncbi:hypothetical protein B9Z44_11165 [Limnohabitans curvus]|uniref:Co-chaperone DjlA N-terminal domain-containing protein n=1 Tax=Limnohabitans curvus TaxID=323423 RepID=A0A315EQQ8_9BURK|nr:TerB family tellurite resistance protein [Limnohabitans curvus]PUE60083.1 hypothetical protein B9Z44_11165 [Limnohabitans curvus]